MDKLKFTLFSIIVLGLLGLMGYWAFGSIQSGSEFVLSQNIDKLQKENESLKKEIEDLKNGVSDFKPTEEPVVAEKPKVEEPVATKPTTPTTYKQQALIDELQELIDDKVTMKLKSVGSRVGTVQKFLNLYNKTSNRIDNDYGATTVKLVTAFQKDQGMTADGEAGATTFKKMIDWLKKQG